MLEFIGTAIVSMIERELIKHEPEIQQLVIDQLDKLSKVLFDYVQGKSVDTSITTPAIEPVSSHYETAQLPTNKD